MGHFYVSWTKAVLSKLSQESGEIATFSMCIWRCPKIGLPPSHHAFQWDFPWNRPSSDFLRSPKDPPGPAVAQRRNARLGELFVAADEAGNHALFGRAEPRSVARRGTMGTLGGSGGVWGWIGGWRSWYIVIDACIVSEYTSYVKKSSGDCHGDILKWMVHNGTDV